MVTNVPPGGDAKTGGDHTYGGGGAAGGLWELSIPPVNSALTENCSKNLSLKKIKLTPPTKRFKKIDKGQHQLPLIAGTTRPEFPKTYQFHFHYM